MMTTMAALLGGLPLALGSGTGSELRRPLGIDDRRRAAAVAAPDALHDAGDLPVHGAARRRLGARRRPGLPDEAAAARRGATGVNVSAPFIRRPIGTWLLASALLIAGAAAFVHLPVAPLPRVDIPTINVSRQPAGREPETMATAVAMPLERRFGRIAGVTEITSTSSLGTTSITVQFELDRDRRVPRRATCRRRSRPPAAICRRTCRRRPRYRKVNPADAPILILALRSKSAAAPRGVRGRQHGARAEDRAGRGRRPGRASAAAQQPAVRVQVDPSALAGLGLGLEDVRTALAGATANSPKGGVGAEQWHAISVNDQLLDAAAWNGRDPAVVGRHRRAAAVRLGDVATVTDDVENQHVAGVGRRRARGARDHPPPAGRQHPRRDRRTSRRCCPSWRGRSRRRSTSRSRSIARAPSAPRSTTSSARC